MGNGKGWQEGDARSALSAPHAPERPGTPTGKDRLSSAALPRRLARDTWERKGKELNPSLNSPPPKYLWVGP